MTRKRTHTYLLVKVALDDVPGFGYVGEDWRREIDRLLPEHYAHRVWLLKAGRKDRS